MSYYQTIYNQLRQLGFTEAGALGMLGNWDCESNCEPNRIQGDFSPYRSESKSYTLGVMNGSISRQEFGSDQRGYGLAQWTYVNSSRTAGRKFNLYDFWKKSGRAIDDPTMQCDFCWWELTVGGYAHVRPAVTENKDLYTAVDKICRLYEQPAVNNIDARFASAKRIKEQIDLNSWADDIPEPETPVEPDEPDYEPKPETEYWPPRMIDKNMTGPDVEVLQAVLKARGYIKTNPDGIFGSYLEEQVKRFQRDHDLEADGVVGPMTWGKLLERE